jgi:hypothetical protein
MGHQPDGKNQWSCRIRHLKFLAEWTKLKSAPIFNVCSVPVNINLLALCSTAAIAAMAASIKNDIAIIFDGLIRLVVDLR